VNATFTPVRGGRPPAALTRKESHYLAAFDRHLAAHVRDWANIPEDSPLRQVSYGSRELAVLERRVALHELIQGWVRS
jgi:hypothetical protein